MALFNFFKKKSETPNLSLILPTDLTSSLL